NKLTKEYIEESDKLEYIFKVILGSFNKKRKKPIGIFTENSVKLFNKLVDDIDDYINKYLNRLHEIELGRAGLLDFSDFFDIQYGNDSDFQAYLQVSSEVERACSEQKKKKKGKGGKLPTEPGKTTFK